MEVSVVWQFQSLEHDPEIVEGNQDDFTEKKLNDEIDILNPEYNHAVSKSPQFHFLFVKYER